MTRLSLGVLRTFLVLYVLLKNSQAQSNCASNCGLKDVNTTTTSVTFQSLANCSITTGNKTYEAPSVYGLTPGTIHVFNVTCDGDESRCCVYTKPAVIRNLSVSDITTSSVSLSWTEPEGESSFYRIEWTGGNETWNETTKLTVFNLTALTPGVNYTFSVIAVAGDNRTEGESYYESRFTKPAVIRNLSVSDITTSSVSLSWTEPEGESSFYRIEWTGGNETWNETTKLTVFNLTALTPGVNYTFSVIAVTGDNITEGESYYESRFTKPAVIRNLSVSDITTSSVSLSWTEPEGESSFYRIEWTGGNETWNETTKLTVFNLTALTPGVNYTFSVIAVAGDNRTEGESYYESRFTKPAVIRNLSVSDITTSSVSLSWTEPEGESSFYRIEWTDGNETWNETTKLTVFNFTALTPGVNYTFSVIAVAGDNITEGESNYESRFTKPAVIRNLSVSDITTSSVSLSWTEPEGESSFYRIEWTDGNETWNETTKLTVFNLTALTPGVNYTFSVIAVTGDNITEGKSNYESRFTKPAVIRNLSVSDITTSSVSLSWTEPEGESSFYRIEWTDGNETWNETTKLTVFNLTALTPGVNYTFSVIAVAGDNRTEGESYYESRFTKPAVIRNLSVSDITTSSVSLSWTEPEGESSFYRIEWTDGNETWNETTKLTVFNLTALTPGVNYTFSVIAVTGDNITEGKSNYESRFTKPAVIRNLSVSDITTSSVSLSWTEPEGESSFYRIEWTDGNETWNETTKLTVFNLTALTPGVNYTFSVIAVTGDNRTEGESYYESRFTKPAVIRNLSVSDITTSSVSLSWTEPEGESSFYRIEWTDGNETWNETTKLTVSNLTALTPGVSYTFSVIAVAGDNITEGESYYESRFTKPAVIRNLSVSDITTSSVSLSWIKPDGESSIYRIDWTNGVTNGSRLTNETSFNITELTAGVQYNFSVTAVAADNTTEGVGFIKSQAVKPAVVGMPNVQLNTTSLTLSWTKSAGQAAGYKVAWDNGGEVTFLLTQDTFAHIPDLIPGTLYTLQVFAIAQDNETLSDPHTISLYTKPAVIRNLTVSDVTTSSVSLSWRPPEGNASFYRVERTDSMISENTNDTSIDITGLTPGSQYNFTVTAVAGPLAGEGTKTTSFVRPEKPVDIMVVHRGTRHLNVNWTLPKGIVDFYNVTLSNQVQVVKITEANFSQLLPGREYVVTVTAVAGEFRSSSEKQIATFPNPPGAIFVHHKTNASLIVEWATPTAMETAPNISYTITYNSTESGGQQESSLERRVLLSSLASGTLYTITVETVGPQGLRSAVIQDSSYTLPNPVVDLRASPESTSSVRLAWAEPLGVQAHYTYRVQTSNPTVNETTINKTFVVPNLQPGTGYYFNVSTVAAPGSEATAEQTFSYTKPKKVTNLTVEALNTTTLKVTWLKQDDHKPTYSYRLIVNNGSYVIRNISTPNETQTVTDLTPGNEYTMHVYTVVEGVMSDQVTISSNTKPEIPSNVIAIGTTDTLLVTWSAVVGHVEFYTVQLLKGVELEDNSTVRADQLLETLFQNLKPGQLYGVKVIAHSGQDTAESTEVQNATFPNPPGPVMIENQTTGSISISWLRPADMELGQYKFSVQLNSGPQNLTANNRYLLENLQSGTLYTISVATVGARGYESTLVKTENYTRPYSVSALTETGITPSTVNLAWGQQDSKVDYSYQVEVTGPNGSPFPPVNTTNTTTIISGLQSGTNYSFTVTTATKDGTTAAPMTVFFSTRPYSVTALRATTVNTTAVHLNWTRPSQYQSDYTYRIQTTACVSNPVNQTVRWEEAVIPGLTPGSNCTFSVSVRAGRGLEGAAVDISQYTKPEAVQPGIFNNGTNSSVQVLWSRPWGNVEQYVVYLSSRQQQVSPPTSLNSSVTSHRFTGLSAAREYSASVVTVSGPFSATSGLVTTATYPNPPGPIEVLEKTTSSLSVKWEEALLTVNSSITYIVTYTSAKEDDRLNTPSLNTPSLNATSLNATIRDLSSGTPYNISVATMGPLAFKSEAIWRNLITTRPESVGGLSAKTAEESVTLSWNKPEGHKAGYLYRVTWTNSSGFTRNETVAPEELLVSGLVPGSPYNFTVTTETDDGTKGALVPYQQCTNASPVSGLECVSPNSPEAKLNVSWGRPKGRYDNFTITQSDNEGNSGRTRVPCVPDGPKDPHCRHIVSGLKHYTYYKVLVRTESCGKPSTDQDCIIQTGITNPPIPEDSRDLASVLQKDFTMFSIMINASLLDSSNGPIRYYGVLVTSDPEGVDLKSGLKEYLVKTHSDWESGSTDAYLATIQEIPDSRREGSHLSVDIGDGTFYKGYKNGNLEPKKEYSYAIVMFTLMEVESADDGLLNVEASLFAATGLYSVGQLPVETFIIGIAVGATLGISVTLFVITICLVIYWKRRKNKESSDIPINSMRAKVSVAVTVEEYEAYYKKQKADSNCGFAEEFEDLKPVGTVQAKNSAEAQDNKTKNRYANVLPYDSSRVKLSIHGSPFDDYINANYIPGYISRKEFIAAQGPLPVTVNEFWRMIWEKNVQTLVMLTRCNENGRVKCEKYWPSDTKHFGNITVTMSSEIPLEDWTIRDFDIKNVKTAETRSVRHFHFTAWPDHGVPETTELLINFRHLVREHMDQYSRHSPTIVHCSAGVGRTGTFIAIDRMIFQIERESIVDVYGTIHDLRMHRPLMVQTEDQYVFLNQCAMDIIRSRTGTNVDLIYQNTAALTIYENVEPRKGSPKNGYHNA